MQLSINANELKAEVMRAGLTLRDLAEALGLTPSGLWRKMRGDTEFTLGEIKATRDLLHLADEAMKAIFLL